MKRTASFLLTLVLTATLAYAGTITRSGDTWFLGAERLDLGAQILMDASGNQLGIASNPVALGGNVASGATDSGNPVKMGCVYNSTLPTYTTGQRTDCQTGTRGSLNVSIVTRDGTLVTEVTVPADAATNAGIGGLRTFSVPALYNGTTVDIGREVANATNSTGTGITAAGNVAQCDDAAQTAITENQFGNVRMDCTSHAIMTQAANYSFGRATADLQIKGAAGFIHQICIEPTTATPTAGLITVYDSLTETGTVIYSKWVFATNPGDCAELDVRVGTGIFVGYDATATNISVTVAYR